MTSSAGISTDKIQEGEEVFLNGLSEEKLKEIVADAAKEVFADYYRRGYPGFEITSGGDTTAHGVAEYCMTTDTIQGLHFYKQGNMKMRSSTRLPSLRSLKNILMLVHQSRFCFSKTAL